MRLNVVSHLRGVSTAVIASQRDVTGLIPALEWSLHVLPVETHSLGYLATQTCPYVLNVRMNGRFPSMFWVMNWLDELAQAV